MSKGSVEKQHVYQVEKFWQKFFYLRDQLKCTNCCIVKGSCHVSIFKQEKIILMYRLCNLCHTLGFDGTKEYCNALLPGLFSSSFPRLGFFHVLPGVTVDIDVCRTSGHLWVLSCIRELCSVLSDWVSDFDGNKIHPFIHLWSCLFLSVTEGKKRRPRQSIDRKCGKQLVSAFPPHQEESICVWHSQLAQA